MPYDPSNPLAARAAEILRANDTGRCIKAAPSLYPHQWSWDAALISIGLAHIDLNRAVAEMRHLFKGQWRNGMIPHIQYDPDVDGTEYFPDGTRWGSQYASADAPRDVLTSGILQPPVHAIAIRQLCDVAGEERGRAIAREFYEPLREWHRYLLSARDPEKSGLITIVHPWESGMDNSPRWDAALARIEVPEDDLPPYTRRDLAHVADPSQRPTDDDYDRYMWILEVLKRGQYRVESINENLPFRVKDVFFSALLVSANESLMQIATLADADLEDLDILEEWILRGRRGLAENWDEELRRCFDTDLVSGERIDVETIAMISPIMAGLVSPAVRMAAKQLWFSDRMVGSPSLRWPLPPTTSLTAQQYHPTRYWRGPVWPVVNWLLWYAWDRIGEFDIAEELRSFSLQQIQEIGFYEYMHPITGEGLGSDGQSWTAAATLDWLAGSPIRFSARMKE
jgi:glucosylglycerate hydrolase